MTFSVSYKGRNIFLATVASSVNLSILTPIYTHGLIINNSTGILRCRTTKANILFKYMTRAFVYEDPVHYQLDN